MKKLKAILFYLFAGYVLPLIGKPGLILHGQMILLMLVAVVMILSQPALDLAEARARQSTDRYSFVWITVLALPAVIVPVVEWAYFGSTALTPAMWAADGSSEVWAYPPSSDGIAMPAGILWAALGLCLIAGGLALRIWAIGTLGGAFTATVQVQEGQALVSTGPYRLVRHPSYLGAYGTFFGLCSIFTGLDRSRSGRGLHGPCLCHPNSSRGAPAGGTFRRRMVRILPADAVAYGAGSVVRHECTLASISWSIWRI